MKRRYRHSVQRIESDLPQAFDQQFWPVLMAIVVLGSIAAGAIVTLMSGPWMWGSLLILPAAAALTIAVLYRLDDSRLRRSLQFAILVSLALHLAVLVMTSLTYIFGNLQIDQPVQTAKRPERRVVITNKLNQLVFQEPKKHIVPDVEVETQKQVTTTKTKPQPVPVVKSKPTVQKQIVQRRKNETSVAKLAKERSQLSRSHSNNQPKIASATRQATAVKPLETKLVPAKPTQTSMQKSASSTSSSLRRQENKNSFSSPTNRPEPSATRRKTEAPKIVRQQKQPVARMRETVAQIPKVAVKPTTNSQQPNPTNKVIKSESSSTNISRQAPTKTVAKKSSNSPATSQTSTRAVTQKTSRRQTQSLSKTATVTSPARKSERRVTAKSPSIRNQAQQTAPASIANNSNKPQPRQLSVSRSTAGVAGTKQSANLDRITGGETSPVNRASDSSSKRQSNRAAQNIAMSSYQRSNLRERGRNEDAKRALRSQNVQWATKAGSQAPARMTLQGAAANIESATSATDRKIAAEKGHSMVDIGSTKFVTETNTQRRGGGGSPDISASVAQSNRTARGRESNLSPAVNSPMVTNIAGPTSVAQSPSIEEEDEEDSAAGALVRSDRPTDAVTGNSGQVAAPQTDSADAVSGAIASRSDRREKAIEAAGGLAGSPSRSQSQDGNRRSRIAQAPSVDRTVEFGTGGNEVASRNGSTPGAIESATTELVRNATDSVSGGSVLGTASRMMAASMSSLPLFADGSGNSNNQKRSRDSGNVSDSNNNSRNNRRGSNSPSPSIGVTAEFDSSGSPNGNGALEIQDCDTGTINRQVSNKPAAAPGIELELDADLGSGGFADRLTRRIGNPDQASSTSDNLSPNSQTRFKRKNFGGVPDVSPVAPIAKAAFRNRNPAALSNSGPRTEAAIERGLEFLARNQLTDGSWSLGQFDRTDPLFQNQLNSDTAATGLAVLAFQGAGYTHLEFKYSAQLKRAIDWLVSNQASDGCLYINADQSSNNSCRMYSHAIAALALAEAYGMTQDPALEAPAQAAMDYISNTQDPDKGGWRYFAERRKRSSDTSVTGWMMMALKSGKLAGLSTRNSTIERIEAWLRVAEDPQQPSQFRYNPYAVDSAGKSRTHGREASVTMTSVGLLMQVYSGWRPDDPRFLRGVEKLLTRLPGDTNSQIRDTYYWYYATQVIKHAGGQYWERWNAALNPTVLDSQELSGELRGSWDPYKPVPDRWGPHGGRLYVTAMNLLSLEVKYRLLPLYEKTID